MDDAEIERRHGQMRAYLNEPESWISMAQTLRHAANVLDSKILPAMHYRYELHNRKAWADYSDEEKRADFAASLDEDLCRPSEMLFQMSYENAIKGLLKLKGLLTSSLSSTHDLHALWHATGIDLEERELGYLRQLTQMNQLGRYRTSSRGLYGTLWVDEFKERRLILDQKLEESWLAAGGTAESFTLNTSA